MFNTLNKLTILRVVDDDKLYSRTTNNFLFVNQFRRDDLQTFLMDYLKLSETERFMIGHQLRDLVKIFYPLKNMQKRIPLPSFPFLCYLHLAVEWEGL